MVVPDDRRHVAAEVQWAQDSLSSGRVGLHQAKLRIGEPAGLLQYAVMYGELPDIMKHRANLNRLQVHFLQANTRANGLGQRLHPLDVHVRAMVLRVNGVGEGVDHRQVELLVTPAVLTLALGVLELEQDPHEREPNEDDQMPRVRGGYRQRQRYDAAGYVLGSCADDLPPPTTVTQGPAL